MPPATSPRPPADSAQNPRPDPGQAVPPRDTSVIADSLNPDSLRPFLPPLGNGGGPRPAATRYVFDADSLRWSGAISLGELLAHIPGVVVVRSGSYGQPEVVSYMGQGAASIELYRDGWQVDPLGEDSLGFDTGRFDIGLMRRIEVEVLPTLLRVHLISDTQTAMRARTEASFATGDASTNSYRIRYLNRWRSGLGVGVGVSYLGTAGPNTSPASSNQLTVVAKLTWMPNLRSGIEFQVHRYNFASDAIDPFFSGAGTTIPAVNVKRSDVFLRAFSSTRGDGLGWRFDALVGSAHYNDSAETLKRSSAQASLTLGYGATRFSAELWGRVRDGLIPVDAGGRAAYSPLRMLTVSGSLRARTVLGGGSAEEANGAAEVRLFPWLALHGDGRWRRLDDTLFVAADTAETVLDWSGGATLRMGPLYLDASMTSRGDFSAPAFGTFDAQIPRMQRVGATSPTIAYRFQPRSWIGVSGWFRHPSTNFVPFDPPTHSVTRLTVRTQFLPKLRRGAFDMEAQLEAEAWSTGVAGADASGAAIPLSGHTVFNFYLQFRLVGALIYWTMRNTQREIFTQVPGFVVPRGFQRFGIRWEFNN